MAESDAEMPTERFIEARFKRAERVALSKDYLHTCEYGNLTRAMWNAAIDALQDVRKGQPLDSEIADWLANAMKTMATGTAEGELKNEFAFIGSRGRGAPKYGENVQKAIRFAVALVRAVKDGRLKGTKDTRLNSPKSTVGWIVEAYGCQARQTVYDWQRAEHYRSTLDEFTQIGDALSEFAKIFDAATEDQRQACIAQIERDIIRRVKMYGRVYREISASTSAIRASNKKRPRKQE